MDIIWAAVIGMGILALSCYGVGLIYFERGYVRGHTKPRRTRKGRMKSPSRGNDETTSNP